MSLGLQYLIFVLLWLFMPDYPRTNPALRGLRQYLRMLWSIAEIFFTYPTLVQACLIGFFTAAPFTSFWTTLTFLLAGPPYEYSSLIIGLFALYVNSPRTVFFRCVPARNPASPFAAERSIHQVNRIGIAAMCVTPLYARVIIDRLMPLWSVILGESFALVGICIGTYTGLFTVAGPVLQAFLLDLGLQTSQIANRAAIYAIAPKARNRVNTAFMVFTFCGQLTGTAVGNRLYAEGGWVLSGSYSVASIGGALLVCLLRGPWEERWVGWKGGWAVLQKKKEKTPANDATGVAEKNDHDGGIPEDPEAGQKIVNSSTEEASLD